MRLLAEAERYSPDIEPCHSCETTEYDDDLMFAPDGTDRLLCSDCYYDEMMS